jgi:hypothetical protein
VGPLSPQHGASYTSGRKDGLQHWRLADATMNKQPRTADKGLSSFRIGVGLKSLHRKKKTYFKTHQRASDLDSSDKRPKRQNKYTRYGAWNFRRFYMSGSLVTVSKELSEYNLDLVGEQEV